jgi:hypothetical protein
VCADGRELVEWWSGGVRRERREVKSEKIKNRGKGVIKTPAAMPSATRTMWGEREKK